MARKQCKLCHGAGKFHVAPCPWAREDMIVEDGEPCTCGEPPCPACGGTGIRQRNFCESVLQEIQKIEDQKFLKAIEEMMVTTHDGERKPLKDVTEEGMEAWPVYKPVYNHEDIGWASFAPPGMCPFIHDNIKVLYGVEPMARQDLPTKCVCGATLTYADEVVFVIRKDDYVETGFKNYTMGKPVPVGKMPERVDVPIVAWKCAICGGLYPYDGCSECEDHLECDGAAEKHCPRAGEPTEDPEEIHEDPRQAGERSDPDAV